MTTGSVPGTLFSALKSKIEARQARVAMIGLGYVGLPLALLYTEQKFPVTGFDIDQRKVTTLDPGRVLYLRILPSEIQQARAQGFSATSDYSQITQMDAIIICVPTPLNEYHEPDLSFITDTANAIAPHLRAGQLVVLESTTYPGTTEEVMVPILEKGNPARLQGFARRRSHRAGILCRLLARARGSRESRRWHGAISRKLWAVLIRKLPTSPPRLYGAIFNRVVRVSSPAAAEMTKLLENIYRCVNIALVNELKLLSLRMGLDIWEVIEAASTKPFGFHPFYPGPGLGGHCIPVDPFYLVLEGQRVGLPHALHRVGGRDQYQHAVSRDLGRDRRAQPEKKGAQRIEGAGPRRRL